MIDSLSDLDGFGIDLKLNNVAAEAFYCGVLRSWFEEIKGYITVPVGDREFSLLLDGDQVASIYIEDSILRMRSFEIDPYEVLICILEFIADNHKKTIDAYNYLEEESYSPSGEETQDFVENYTEEERDDDSDDEWI